jgi:hypothetical protein
MYVVIIYVFRIIAEACGDGSGPFCNVGWYYLCKLYNIWVDLNNYI